MNKYQQVLNYSLENRNDPMAREFLNRVAQGEFNANIPEDVLYKTENILGASIKGLPSKNTRAIKGALKKTQSLAANYFAGISSAFKEGEQYGEEMQSRRLETENRTFLNPGRLVSRGLEEVGRPILGAIEGATAPIAKTGIAVGKALATEEQENLFAEGTADLAQKYENFKSNLSPEARVQLDEIATLFGLGSSFTGGAAALKLGKTGIKGAKAGIKTAIESPDFKEGVDLGFEGAQKARGAVIDTTKATINTVKNTPKKLTSKLGDVSEAKNMSDLNTYLKSKRSLEQANIFYKQKKNIDIPKYLSEPNLFKGIKVTNGSVDPSEAVEILENRANLFMDAKKKTLPIMDKYLPPKNKSELQAAAIESIKGLLPEADEADLIKLINKQIEALPNELNYQKLDTLRRQFRKAGVDAKGIQRPDSQYKALEDASRNMIFDASDNLPFDTNGELAALNKEIKDALSAKEFLDKTLRGQKVNGGQLGGYVGKTIGAVAGSKLGVLGAIAGSELGGAISRILQNNQLGSQFKFSLIKDLTDDPKIIKEIEKLLGREAVYQPLALPSPKNNIRVQKGSTKTIELPQRSQTTIDEAEATKRAKGIIKTTNRQANKK